MSEAILAAEGLSKSFGAEAKRVTALDQVSLRARAGVVTGLIGPDAAGKTTFMRLAAGLLTPDAGRIAVLGLDATRDALKVQALLGYMPQRFGLYEDLSVQENLDLYADLQGVPRADRAPRYAELMHMTGLAPFMQRLAGRLSGGMKQKLGLACTLVRAPRLLLLDEPTVGVDPVSRRELWAIVDRLVREDLQRFRCRGRAHHAATALPEVARQDREEDRVVLHHQHPRRVDGCDHRFVCRRVLEFPHHPCPEDASSKVGATGLCQLRQSGVSWMSPFREGFCGCRAAAPPACRRRGRGAAAPLRPGNVKLMARKALFPLGRRGARR